MNALRRPDLRFASLVLATACFALSGGCSDGAADGSADAGTVDGGGTDARATDGSVGDATTHDGGATDGSVVDASPHDGSATDGSVVDGSPHDGSTTDAATDGATTDGSVTDGGTSDGSIAIDAGPTECSPECGSSEVCVRKQFNGGAVRTPDDAGMCPAGYHVNGGFCQADPTFACRPRPVACATTLSCTCASSVCESYMCTDTTDRQVNCVLNAP
ncbi:MAG: hypothetical protein U0169_04865 [Polyangiaceae bacterium]